MSVPGGSNYAAICSVGFVAFGKGYWRHTELPEVSGTGMEVLQNSQNIRAGTQHDVPVLRVLCHGS